MRLSNFKKSHNYFKSGKKQSGKPSKKKTSTKKPVKKTNQNHRWGFTPKVNTSKVNTSKQAIMIGLNYPGSRYELKGCVNDIKNGAKFLTKKGYKVKTLFDQQVSRNYNVLEALTELKGSSSKTVFFHYSGHGTQQKDLNGDESDGKDEVIYSKDGVLVSDDDIHRVLSQFGKDKTVFLVFDCCHSGSIADLPFILSSKSYTTEKYRKPVDAKIVCISGCRDPQTSADVWSDGAAFGALSHTLYGILRKHRVKPLTWRQLYAELLVEMSKKRYAQVPMISVSDPAIFGENVSF